MFKARRAYSGPPGPATADIVPRSHRRHEEFFLSTRLYVAGAVGSILGGNAEVIGRDLAEVGKDLRKSSPMPVLQGAAKTLISIWEAARAVKYYALQTNKRASLRLTDRCSTILMSVHDIFNTAKEDITAELSAPLQRLDESFKEVLGFLNDLSGLSFTARYLHGQRIRKALDRCNNSLTDTLRMFKTSMEILLRDKVLTTRRQQREDAAAIIALLADVGRNSQPAPPELPARPRATDAAGPSRGLLPTSEANNRDAVYNTSEGEPRQLVRDALSGDRNDDELVAIFDSVEMREAITVLRRVLQGDRGRGPSASS
ncbi:hypothetical protein LXA43DRAFT_1094521 [Ganoderma leucocontextum]|nr:hypothetical protein LXA43DRAFT_1094521 [Ganoderma leucocontextum]